MSSIIVLIGFVVVLQSFHVSADDDDSIDWAALKAEASGVVMDPSEWALIQKTLAEDDAKHLMVRRYRMRREATDEERDKRLPRMGVRSTVEDKEEEDREKRLPRLGVRAPLPRFGARDAQEEERDKRLPRMGVRDVKASFEEASNNDEDSRTKRLPRVGRAAPFPRLGRAAPFPRLGRGSPFPRLGRTVYDRAAPFPRLGRGNPFPRLGE